MIKNYTEINNETPIFGVIKLSTVVHIVIFASIPILIAYNYGPTLWGLFWGIMALFLGLLGIFVSEFRKDGRKIIPYLMDKYTAKIVQENDVYRIKKYNIGKLVDSLGGNDLKK